MSSPYRISEKDMTLLREFSEEEAGRLIVMRGEMIEGKRYVEHVEEDDVAAKGAEGTKGPIYYI